MVATTMMPMLPVQIPSVLRLAHVIPDMMVTHHADGTCTNNDESYTCACNDGFNGSGKACTDIDECLSADATCINSHGAYSCAGKSGYTGDGFAWADNDESALGPDNCDVNASCANNKGSFVCTSNAGCKGSGDVCTNINKWAAETNPYDSHGAFTNIDASFDCACEAGYAGDGFTCSDINECPEADSFDVNAACDNVAWYHVYTCNRKQRWWTDLHWWWWWRVSMVTTLVTSSSPHVPILMVLTDAGVTKDTKKNGVECEDVNEFTNDHCHADAHCTNNVGSFVCTKI